MQKYLCIEGIIGSGKTTLAENLTLKQSNKVILKERFTQNKLLEFFYQNSDFALLTEYSFLINRFYQLKNHFNLHHSDITIADFSFYKCLWFAEINLTTSIFKQFKKQFELLNGQTNPQPHCIVFLDISPKRALQNIINRNRLMEQNISIDYLQKLDRVYKKYLSKLSIPIIEVQVKDYNTLVQEVNDKLKDFY